METCPVCGGQLKPLEVTQGNFTYDKCDCCGYISLSDNHRLEHDREKDRYLLHQNTARDAGYVKWLRRFLDYAYHRIPDDRSDAGLDILDFGSGPNPVMSEMMKGDGHRALAEDIHFAPGRREGPFDLVCSVEVFEHLADPVESLVSLAARLKPHGVICISTEFVPGDENLFDTWHYRSDPTHIGFFTRKSLGVMAHRAGMMLLHDDGTRYACFGLPCAGRT